MTLAPLKLDDLTWKDLSDTARDRIASASAGQWTLHAPVDPGVTLLELFAWHLDQRLFWMDQVSDSFTRGLLRLLDEAQQPVVSATTVMAFQAGQADLLPFATIPGGIELGLRDRLDPFNVTILEPVTVLPVAEILVEAGGDDLTGSLRQGDAAAVFSAGGQPGDMVLTLRLSEALAPAAHGGTLSILVQLQVPEGDIPPEWLPDAVNGIEPPAELNWWYASPAGLTPFAMVEDGTGGLRRSGMMRFEIPADWQGTGPDAEALYNYKITISTESATFTAPPLLTGLTANVTPAVHRYRIQIPPEALEPAKAWLPLPGLALVLAEEDQPPLPSTVDLVIRERDGTAYPWQATDDLAFHGPEARVFVVDRLRKTLLFGDGLTGRIPIPDANHPQPIHLSYSAGGGTSGNLGARLVWEGESNGTWIQARNAVPGRGGKEEESIAEARERVAADLKARYRAVTAGDYEHLAVTTPGVAIARAHAAIGHHPDFPCIKVPGAVTVFAVAFAPRGEDDPPEARVAAPIMDPGAYAAVQSRLANTRLAGSEVFLRNPRYRRVALRVEVASTPFDPNALQRRIHTRLETFLDPLIGGEAGLGWPFGEPVRPSALLRQAQAVLDDGEILSVAIGLDGEPPTESCRDVHIGDHDLVVLETIAIHLQSPVFARGGLR